MNRTEELWGIARVINPSFQQEPIQEHASARFLLIAKQTNENIRHLSALLDSIEKLSARKEYSNDPSAEIAELAKTFQSKIVFINRDLSTISDLHKANQYRISQHQHAHDTLIVSYLRKCSSEYIESFQKYLKKHQGNVQKRTERVSKYFTPTTPTKPVNNNYALFNSTNTNTAHSELRRRLPIVDVTSNNPVPQQQQQQRRSNQHEHAQKIESSIAQMSELFSQMASLVLEQSQTISRIEDDVESGLMDTKDAHASMTHVYEITKGNRGIILKIFALLVFFILLFLVWT